MRTYYGTNHNTFIRYNEGLALKLITWNAHLINA